MTCCCSCTSTCKKCATLSVGLILFSVGLVMVLCGSSWVQRISESELSLKNNRTMGYTMWKKTPIPMYAEFYLYNWTNYAEFADGKWPADIKPNFTECGPYTYSEVHTREQVQFNDDNNTITYKTKRVWHFLPDKSVGSLDDRITTASPILLTIGYFIRHKDLMVQEGMNFNLKQYKYNFTVTKTVKEFLFDGYDDVMLDLLHRMNLSGVYIPYDKFGWFYSRNESVDYDGSFTMYNGADNINKMGRLTLWKGANHTIDYPEQCGMVNGTSGELWYPVKSDETIDVFTPDLCSTITLRKQGVHQTHGIEAPKYVGAVDLFDNGTRYPHMKCFSPGETVPSGTRNISICKFNAPVFVSFPHFYLADPAYREAVVGMRPNRTEHEFMMSVEPTTGIPLSVRANVQVNMFLPQVEGIDLLKHVRPTFMPFMWFRTAVDLTENYALEVKVLLLLPTIIYYTGFGLIGIGVLLFIIGIVMTVKRGWTLVRQMEDVLVTGHYTTTIIR